MTEPISFPLLLERLNYGEGEHVAICSRRPGGPFTATVTAWPLTSDDRAAIAGHVAANADLWFGVNPVTGPPGRAGRGTADQVTRLAALWADLDVKPGAFTDLDHAQQVVHDLSTALHADPVAVVHSGHGLQPYWALEADDPAVVLDGPAPRRAASATLRRWGRLVHHLAGLRGASVDSVFDLPRVLRLPGTWNHKPEPEPAPAPPPAAPPGLGPARAAARLAAAHEPDLSAGGAA